MPAHYSPRMLLSHHPAGMVPAVSEPGDGAASRRRLGLLSVTIAGFFMAGDITITNVALPTISRELDSSIASLQWVIDSYNIALAGLVLLGAGLGERYSRKWTYLCGLGVLIVGSLAAGLSTSVGQLVASRTVMGIGAALIVAPALSVIAVIFPPDQRARAVASWSAAGAVGLAVAPIAGGVLLSFASWGWVFLINVPFLALSLVLGVVSLPNSRAPNAKRLDVVGAVLSVAGLGLFLGAIIEGPNRGWTDPIVLSAMAVGLIGLIAFVAWELRTPQPMFEIRVLARPGVLGAAIALFAGFVAMPGTIFLVAQQLQEVNGASPIMLGLALVPFAVTLWLVSRYAARLAKAIGARATLNLSVALMVLSFAFMAVTSRMDVVALVVLGTMLAAAGCGLAFPIGSVAILNDLPDALTGSASGTSMLARMAGASVGMAILGTVLASSITSASGAESDAEFSRGITAAYIAATIVTAALAVLQFAILRRWHPTDAP